jgi:GDP-L-fucose synthase
MKLCEKIFLEYGRKFISCMPTNIYGPGDNFSEDSSHVIPALIRRMNEAKKNNVPNVVIWGSGESRREFLHVDDLAEAVLWLMNNYEQADFLNVGTGKDVSIKELAVELKKIVRYEGELVFDTTKPDGMPKKLLDVSKLSALGWDSKIGLEEGLESTFNWFKENVR